MDRITQDLTNDAKAMQQGPKPLQGLLSGGLEQHGSSPQLYDKLKILMANLGIAVSRIWGQRGFGPTDACYSVAEDKWVLCAKTERDKNTYVQTLDDLFTHYADIHLLPQDTLVLGDKTYSPSEINQLKASRENTETP